MSDSYTIARDDLVELIATSCLHVTAQERAVNEDEVDEADGWLALANELLERTGVRDVIALNLEIGERMAELTENKPDFPDPPAEDPYLWESGT